MRIPKKVIGRLSLAIFTMFIVWQIAVSILYAIFLETDLYYDIDNLYLTQNMINFAALYLLALPSLLLIIRGIPEKSLPEPFRPRMKFNFGTFLLLIIFCFGATYVVSFLGTMVLGVSLRAPSPFVLPQSYQDSFFGEDFLTNLIFGACVPALLEEFVFRYLLYKKMRGSGDLIYILFSGIAFGMFHGNFSQMFYAIAIGLIYGWIYAKTNRIWYSVGLHFINNFFSFAVIPWLLNSSLGILFFFLLLFSSMILAVIVFVVLKKKIWAGLTPPTEPGWPQAKLKKWQIELRTQLSVFNASVAEKTLEFPPYSKNPVENYQIAVNIQQQEEYEKKAYSSYYASWTSPYTGRYYENANFPYILPLYYNNYLYINPYTMMQGYGYMGPQCPPYAYGGVPTYTVHDAKAEKEKTIPAFLLKNAGTILFISVVLVLSVLSLLMY